MTFRNDETIQCARCGRLFTWSYSEQRVFRERGLKQPKLCSSCKEIQRGERRSSQFDHPAYPLPPAHLPPPPVEAAENPPPPPPAPPPAKKRSAWWRDPASRLTAVLWLLIFLALVGSLLLLMMLFSL